MNRSQKRPIVYAVRDFPPGCGTHTNVPEKPFKNPRTSDVVAADSEPEGTCLEPEPAFRNFDHDHVLAAPPKHKGACSKQEQEFKTSNHDHDRVLAAPAPSGMSLRHSDQHDHTPREEVLEVLRVFKDVYRELDRDKQAKRGRDSFDATARIDLKTQAVLEKMGKPVNTEKRIGSVPGINVGDEFQYKTELRVVGLHFKTMCGIDYMKIGDVKLATSIVASEGYGYNDKFDADVMVYTGEGGNVISKGKKTEDQRMVKGNLALANSMRHKSEVRVIRGDERWDRKGKRYVYDGLYLVDKYWLEKGVSGKGLYKFKLRRIPGQQRPLT